MKLPSQLKTVSFPDCIELCRDPDRCPLECMDKIKEYESKQYVTVILFVIAAGIILYIIKETLYPFN